MSQYWLIAHWHFKGLKKNFLLVGDNDFATKSFFHRMTRKVLPLDLLKHRQVSTTFRHKGNLFCILKTSNGYSSFGGALEATMPFITVSKIVTLDSLTLKFC